MSATPVVVDGERVELNSPVAMPQATAFLWNPLMMLQLNCRGFAVGQHLQPEPARYAHAPTLEDRTFMQPEQPHYAHHPGRFVYLRDDEDRALSSVPYEPVRRLPRRFVFRATAESVEWELADLGVEIRWSVSLAADDPLELWTLAIHNPGREERRLSACPYFPIGYMSWMYQSASYRMDLGGIVARSVTPWQRLEEYATVQRLRDCTFLLHDTPPDAWEARQAAFEGEGGLQRPSALEEPLLGGGDALYESPAAVLQYRLSLEPAATRRLRFLFGPARDDAEIAALRDRYLSANGFADATAAYGDWLRAERGCLRLASPDGDFDAFANHWLDRQVRYQAETHRLTTDPQTRNMLQDAMGMAYLQPAATRRLVEMALAQQREDGSMPDGILAHPGAELKYINRVPHSDHCVWLPLCLRSYLDETADYALLDVPVSGTGGERSVRQRVDSALDWLLDNRDQRGLGYIAQGDWCDPLNMAGHLGRGVSGWLSMATVYALRTWAGVLEEGGDEAAASGRRQQADEVATAVQHHLWDGCWFARGINDDDRPFGVAADPEGRIFLNAQSWAMLAGIATPEQIDSMVAAVAEELEGPHGVTMLGPPYTGMREDVGRLTQKFPGVAENGSVYNHAAAFYVYALYRCGRADRAWRLLRQMLPGPEAEDYLQRGQLPLFLPNYYRGAWRAMPRTAGRSSQLVHTGTAAWFYRILVDGLFGLRGCPQGLLIQPQLPAAWERVSLQRRFRGAAVQVEMTRRGSGPGCAVAVDGQPLADQLLQGVEAGGDYRVDVWIGGDVA